MARPIRWAVGVTAVAAVATTILKRRRSVTKSAADQPVSTTGRLARQGNVVRLGGRVATTVASNRAKWVFASAERKTALNEELELRTAEDVTSTLGNMKGVLMKLGQIASFVDDGMPEPIRAALGQL